jgi:hypothetical protein
MHEFTEPFDFLLALGHGLIVRLREECETSETRMLILSGPSQSLSITISIALYPIALYHNDSRA